MPIQENAGGTVITGSAVNWYAIQAVISAMNLYLATGMLVNRAYTAKAMRDFATRYTGKKYQRSRTGMLFAREDLQAYAEGRDPDSIERK